MQRLDNAPFSTRASFLFLHLCPQTTLPYWRWSISVRCAKKVATKLPWAADFLQKITSKIIQNRTLVVTFSVVYGTTARTCSKKIGHQEKVATKRSDLCGGRHRHKKQPHGPNHFPPSRLTPWGNIASTKNSLFPPPH